MFKNTIAVLSHCCKQMWREHKQCDHACRFFNWSRRGNNKFVDTRHAGLSYMCLPARRGVFLSARHSIFTLSLFFILTRLDRVSFRPRSDVPLSEHPIARTPELRSRTGLAAQAVFSLLKRSSAKCSPRIVSVDRNVRSKYQCSCILQFIILRPNLIPISCVLHRPTSQVIHRSG